MNNIIKFPNSKSTEEKLADIMIKYLEKNGEDVLVQYIMELEEKLEIAFKMLEERGIK